MTDPRQDLAAAARAAAPAPQHGARAILDRLHNDPRLVERVRIETLALPPLIWTDGTQLFLTSLLTERRRQTETVHPAWGAATWTWPDGELVGVDHVPVVDTDAAWELRPAHRFAALLDTIDRTTDLGEASAAELEDAVRAALAPQVRSCYRALLADRSAQPLIGAATDARAEADSRTVSAWARDATALAQRFGLSEMVLRLNDLRGERDRPSFRLAVVGEFNRGKSRLVNDLIGRPVLPTGQTAVTTTFVVIRPGEQDVLEIRRADGNPELRPLDEHAFDGLLGAASAPAEQAEPRLTATVDSEWLRSAEIELIDTPGANDRVDRLQQLRRAVAVSDMVVFAISALSPLSLSERALIVDEVIKRHVSHVAVAVTMLDLVDDEDRAGVMRHVENRIAEIAPAMTVVAAGADEATRSAAVDALRAFASSRAETSGRVALRNERLARQLGDVCNDLVVVGREGVALAAADASGRAAATREVENLLSHSAAYWQQLRAEVDHRSQLAEQAVLKSMDDRRREYADSLVRALERTHDPREWWEYDLPVQLRSTLHAIAARLAADLTRGIAEDAELMTEQVRARLDAHSSVIRPTIAIPVQVRKANGTVADLSTKRTMTRLGATTGLVVIGGLASFAIGLHVPIFTSAGAFGGGLLGERKINQMTAVQRADVRRLLDQTIDETFAEFTNEAVRATRIAYTELLQGLRRDEQIWAQARLAAAATVPDRPQLDWAELARSAAELRTTIESTLDQPDRASNSAASSGETT